METLQTAARKGTLLDVDAVALKDLFGKKKREDMPVNADPFGIRIITKSSLNENVAQLRQEIKVFKKSKIHYSLKSTEAVVIRTNDEQQAEILMRIFI